MNCEDCIRYLYPDDPRVKAGRYGICGCDYCNKPQYERDNELPKPTPEIPEPLEVKQLRHQIDQTKAGFLHLQNKFNEHLDKKKKDII